MPRVDIRLYGILDQDRLAGMDLARLAKASVDGGATLLQLRDKHGSARRMIDSAKAILDAVGGRAPLLINDRVDVALAAAAQGVHVGRDDIPPAAARGLLGRDAIIGITLKNEDDLLGLDPASVDYGCIGGVYATTSKDNPDPPVGLAGLARLHSLARRSGLPVGAIAGIDLARARDCVAAGADGVAIISALYLEPDVTATAQAFRRTIDEALAARGSEP